MKLFSMILVLVLSYSMPLSAQDQPNSDQRFDRFEGVEQDLWTDDMSVEQWYAKHRPGVPVPDLSTYAEGHVEKLKELHNRSIRAKAKLPRLYKQMRESAEETRRHGEELQRLHKLYMRRFWRVARTG